MKKVLMFSASWCGPCRQAKPVFNQLKESVKTADFEIVDIDENPVMTNNFNITGVPTFVVMENDTEIQRLVGGANLNKLKEIL